MLLPQPVLLLLVVLLLRPVMLLVVLPMLLELSELLVVLLQLLFVLLMLPMPMLLELVVLQVLWGIPHPIRSVTFLSFSNRRVRQAHPSRERVVTSVSPYFPASFIISSMSDS